MTEELRHCRLCRHDKPIEQFALTSNKVTRRRVCRACRSLQKAAWNFDLSISEVRTLIAQSDGRCQCCKKPKQLVIDHDHFTGKIRGLIYSNCNVGLGMFQDDPELLEDAAVYLRGGQLL